MKRALLITGLLACGCGSGLTPTPPPTATPDGELRPITGDEPLVLNDIELYMHKIAPTAGTAQQPTFRVAAKDFVRLNDADSVWAFENAEATIYGEDEGPEDDMVITAGRGRFEEDKRAMLQDGVVARIGTMTLTLDTMEWINPQENVRGEVRSESPVVVDDPGIQVEAQSIHLYPEEQTFEMTNVTGLVRFRRDAV